MAEEESEENDRWKEHNERSRKRLESQYFDVKNLAVILIDFVPYERKAEMIEGLKRLFQYDKLTPERIIARSINIDKIPDMKESGLLSGGVGPIGTLLSNKISWTIPMGSVVELPDPFERIEIWIAQLVDFSYCLMYTFVLNDDYQNRGIRDSFVQSEDFVEYKESLPSGRNVKMFKPKGPEFEITLKAYEREAEVSLSKFSYGLFLNENYSPNRPCPSVRVLSTPKIDFTNIEKWINDHFLFLRHLGMGWIFSRYNGALLTYQEFTLFGESAGFPKGITLLYSEQDIKTEPGDSVEHIITYDTMMLTSHSFIEFLFPVYWAAYHINDLQRKWTKELEALASRSVASHNTAATPFQDIKQQTMQTIQFYGQFASVANKERIHIRKMSERLDMYAKKFAKEELTPMNLGRQEFNIYDDLQSGIERWLKQENQMLDEVQRQIETLHGYYRDLTNAELGFTNISLQNKVKWLTIAVVSLAAISAFVAIVTDWDAIISFFT